MALTSRGVGVGWVTHALPGLSGAAAVGAADTSASAATAVAGQRATPRSGHPSATAGGYRPRGELLLEDRLVVVDQEARGVENAARAQALEIILDLLAVGDLPGARGRRALQRPQPVRLGLIHRVAQPREVI